jgi:predicted transport protein
MSNLNYIKPEKLAMKGHPDLNEKWVQNIIAEDPSILGLGDLILKDKERQQPKAGRLDLLLQDSESNHRYEVEIQLGQTDESHIIRTLEYWDIEKKRYPQYDHTAVIVAENITSRFLNVISLFNGNIPLIAIQLNAYKIEGNISLVSTIVLDEMTFGLIEEDEEIQEVADRNYWIQQGTQETVELADKLLEIIKTFDNDLEFKYNKFYIGLAKNEQPNNFIIFRPKKNHVRLEIRLSKSDELERKLNESNLDMLDYDKRWGRYRIRLTKKEIKENINFITELLEQAYTNSNS